MQPPARVRYAPVVDAICILVFVLVGRGRHEIDEGVGWFFTVLWPLYVGWFGVALATRLYTRRRGIWLALTVTWLGGIAIAAVLRGAFTDRPYVSIFTVIAIAFLGLTTFGWRAIAALIARSRGRETSPA
jgi:Protein of unknown function (DUF3054)